MKEANKIAKLNLVKEDRRRKNSKVSALSPREIVSELDRYVIGQNNVIGGGDKLLTIRCERKFYQKIF